MAVGLALMAVLGYATSAITMRLALEHLRPSLATLLLLTAGGGVLLLVAGTVYSEEVVAIAPVAVGWISLIAFSNFFVGLYTRNLSIQLVGASRSAVVLAGLPLAAALFAIPLGGERWSSLLAVGTLAIFAGIALLVTEGAEAQGPRGSGSVQQAWGYGAALVTVFAFGSTQFIIRKVSTEYTPSLVVAGLAMTMAAFMMLASVSLELPKVLRAPRRGPLWASCSGLLVAGAIAGHYSALSMAPVVKVTPILAIVPLVTLVQTRLFLGQLERVTRRLVLGTLLVVGGVVLVVLG